MLMVYYATFVAKMQPFVFNLRFVQLRIKKIIIALLIFYIDQNQRLYLKLINI